jgi:ER-bound oxygenase mpaB/B'/Rubber oxygenase, catalytic domain
METATAEQLAARIAVASSKASQPGYAGHLDPDQVDVEAWNFVGDPIAEALVSHLRSRKLMGGDTLKTVRDLRATGVAEAEAFLADVETVPGWADFEAMRAGADMALRYPIGMLMGFHGGFPFTYVDAATARVMASTGRMTNAGADFRRRYWETISGFIGALDVDGMKPGGPRWEEWVRIRLLHTSIRMGILRSGRWDETESTPISQAATASGAHIFGPYRLNVIKRFGGRISPAEAEGFTLMWRWIARIEGANSELLGTSSDEQLRLAQRIHQHLYDPSEDSRIATDAMIEGLARMKSVYLAPKGIHAEFARILLTEDMVQTLPGRDLAADLGLHSGRPARCAVAILVRGHRLLSRLIAALPISARRRELLFREWLGSGLQRRPPTYQATPVVGDQG